MELYHVSKRNKDLQVLDMSRTFKTDIEFTGDLISKVECFCEFYDEYQSSKIQNLVEKKGWIKEKIATEAIFEYVRKSEFTEKPSRLVSAYFTNSIENAENFNQNQRGNQGAIFVFEADGNNVFYFNMDLFHEACQCFEKYGMQEKIFLKVKEIAKNYWGGYEDVNNTNCEILYRGMPKMKRFKMAKSD